MGTVLASLLGQVNVAQGGAVAVLVIVVLLILFGRLLPRKSVSDVLADRDRQIAALRAERDTWRTAHEESEKARMVEREQSAEALELARTTVQLLGALPPAPSQRREVTDGVAQSPQAPTP